MVCFSDSNLCVKKVLSRKIHIPIQATRTTPNKHLPVAHRTCHRATSLTCTHLHTFLTTPLMSTVGIWATVLNIASATCIPAFTLHSINRSSILDRNYTPALHPQHPPTADTHHHQHTPINSSIAHICMSNSGSSRVILYMDKHLGRHKGKLELGLGKCIAGWWQRHIVWHMA